MLTDYPPVYSCTRVLLPSLLRNTPILQYTKDLIPERAMSEQSPRPWVLGVVLTDPKIIKVNNISNCYEKLRQLL